MFIHQFSKIARPLATLMSKTQLFMWDEQCQMAFEWLNLTLICVPILAIYNMSHPLALHTDAYVEVF